MERAGADHCRCSAGSQRQRVAARQCNDSLMINQERWQVSGSTAELYERHVASWFAKWADDLVERAGIVAGSSVLDLGCGTGVVSRALGPVIGTTGAITASDLNEAMLAEAERLGVEGAPVQWRCADAESLPFESDVFDALLCQQALQFVPNKEAAVSEMRRVLRPGGVAAVSVWSRLEENPYIAALANGLAAHLSEPAGEIMRAPMGFGDPAGLAEIFSGAGFTSLEVESAVIMRSPIDATEAVEGNLRALPIAEQIEAMHPDALRSMIDQIADELSDYITGGILTMPSTSLVAVATA